TGRTAPPAAAAARHSRRLGFIGYDTRQQRPAAGPEIPSCAVSCPPACVPGAPHHTKEAVGTKAPAASQRTWAGKWALLEKKSPLQGEYSKARWENQGAGAKASLSIRAWMSATRRLRWKPSHTAWWTRIARG